MLGYNKNLRKLLRKVPGRKTLGIYRFLPVFFLAGAGIEFLMIKLNVGEVNFYKVYKRKQVEKLVTQKLEELDSLENQILNK